MELSSHPDIDIIYLRKQMAASFNIDELKTLCFDLNIEYENLPGETLEGKTRELVKYCYRNGGLAKLFQECQSARPNVEWSNKVNVEEEAPDIDNNQALREYYQLVKAFNRNRHLPFSNERTIEGDEIAFRMRELAPMVFDKFDVSRWLYNKSQGKRLAAIEYLNWSQDIEFFDELIERLFLERPFIQFHILLTIDGMLDQLDSRQESQLVDKFKEFETKGDASIEFWRDRILQEVS